MGVGHGLPLLAYRSTPRLEKIPYWFNSFDINSDLRMWLTRFTMFISSRVPRQGPSHLDFLLIGQSVPEVPLKRLFRI